jgi:cytochrome c5
MTPGGGEGPAEVGGDELLQARCTVCHDLGRVEAASKTQAEWEATVARLVRVMPYEYRAVLEAERRMRERGVPEDEAPMAAFT